MANIGIDGVARKIGSVYIGAPKFEPVFADNTWSQIIEACQRNAVPETWNVGDQKPMSIGGTDYIIDIIGKNHDTFSDGSGAAPLTFGMHDCYGTTYGMGVGSNSGGYDSTPMHKETLPAIKSLMPTEVQAAITPVDKKSSAGSKSTEIETISCGLFLLSEVEVYGSLTHSATGEGSQYEYYKAGNSKVKNHNGSAIMWRLRSPAIASTYSYCTVNTNGSNNYVTASNVLGVAFAFCFGGTSGLNPKNGIARKIIKSYIGVNGVARKWFSMSPILFYFYYDPNDNYSGIGDFTLEAEEGMTFGEWCESEYNTIGAYMRTHLFFYDGEYEVDDATPDAVISADAVYYYKYEM